MYQNNICFKTNNGNKIRSVMCMETSLTGAFNRVIVNV